MSKVAESTGSKLEADRWKLVLPGARPEDVVAFERQVVDFFVSAAELLGVPKSVAAIYGIVFASAAPLSFADIEARLNISKGSISQGLRVLRDVGAIKPATSAQLAAASPVNSDESDPLDAGSSKLRAPICYVPDLELRKLVGRFIEKRLELQLAAGSSKLSALAKSVPGRNGQAAELKKRVQSLSDWSTKTRALIPLVRTILNLGG